MIELNGKTFRARIEFARFRLNGVCNRTFRFQNLVNATSGNVGTRQHNRNHANHQERHDDNHGIGDEGNHVTGLNRARINIGSAHPHDKNRNSIHDQHHRGHHECHGPVREQLRTIQRRTCLVEALFLILLPIECADNR